MISPRKSGGVEVAIDELLAEQGRRLRGRDAKPVEEYLEGHPSLRDDPESVLALIFNEVALREELGESPRAEEYVRRFPGLAREVAEQFEVHRALRVGPAPADCALEVAGGDAAGAPGPEDPLKHWPDVPGYEILGLLGQRRDGSGLPRARQEPRRGGRAEDRSAREPEGDSPVQAGVSQPPRGRPHQPRAAVRAHLQRPWLVHRHGAGRWGRLPAVRTGRSRHRPATTGEGPA